MSVISVREINIGNLDASQGEDRVYEFRRRFLVQTDNALDGALLVLADASIPKIGDPYSSGYDSFSAAFCVNRSARMHSDSNKLWEVDCSYKQPKNDQENKQEENPLDRPAEVSWSFQAFQKPIDKDLDDEPIVNTFNTPFNPFPEIDDSRPILVIIRNEAHPFNYSRAISYQDAVNSDNFYGFDPGQAKMAGIAAQRRTEYIESTMSTLVYWQVTYEIHFRREGWQLKILNRGTEYFDDNGAIQVDKDDAGNPTGSEVLLDNDAKKLAEDADPIYLDFRVYEEKAFGPLGLE